METEDWTYTHEASIVSSTLCQPIGEIQEGSEARSHQIVNRKENGKRKDFLEKGT